MFRPLRMESPVAYANRLGVSPRTVNRLIARGALVALRIPAGNRQRFFNLIPFPQPPSLSVTQ
jgi:hypothetical protein